MKHRLFYSLSFAASLLILFAQHSKAQITQITGIKYKLTERGLEIILVTPTPKNLLSFPRIQGNTQIFNISNTQLSLPCSNNFRRNKPVPEIQFISVTSQNNNGISIAVRGEKTLPKLLVFISQAKIDCIKCSFQYPEELRKKGIEGRAEVVLDIDEQGNVIKMSLGSSSGNTQLDNAILTQVRDMKFTANACGETNLILRANPSLDKCGQPSIKNVVGDRGSTKQGCPHLSWVVAGVCYAVGRSHHRLCFGAILRSV